MFIAVVDTAKYRNRSLPSFDGLRCGGSLKYWFSSWNAALHSSVQTKAYFRVLKKGRHLSVALEMNLLRVVILPVSDCTSLTDFGDNI